MNILVKLTTWQRSEKPLKEIRERVFLQEQNVPIELEWDELDEQAYHILAEAIPEHMQAKKLAIGTARIIINNKQAHIGRMAVLADWRGQGTGSKMLQYCIDECIKKQVEVIILNAQLYVTKFYQKAGFKITSEEFLDAGIAHKQMTLTLPKASLFRGIKND